jgi:polyphosphate kinase
MKNDSTRYLNRELNWLEHQQQLLDEASNNSVPLLERLRFLAVISQRLDEFFMVRCGGIKLLVSQDCEDPDISGMTPAQQLQAIMRRTHRLVSDQYQCYQALEAALEQSGIRRLHSEDLTDRQMALVEKIFDGEISAVLTPLAVASCETFPRLANQTLNVCVRLQSDDSMRFAVIPLGKTTHRLLTVQSEGGYAFVLLEDAVALFADRFFPGEEVVECAAFRISCNAQLGVRKDLAGDLLAQLDVCGDIPAPPAYVRLEIANSASEPLLQFLRSALHISADDVFANDGPLDLSVLEQVSGLSGFDTLKYPAWPPQASPDVDLRTSVFETLARGDVLLYHPYDSFDPVVRMIEEAADDPDVIAIKQTLYGTDHDSPIVSALIRAAENEKYVTTIIELKPRYGDPEKVEWAKTLEQASIQVIYGIRGLRTHAKICIIVRREPGGIHRYVHFGTGDYSEATARSFSDVSLLTSNEELGADATSFFNSVTSHSQPVDFRVIDAAPTTLRVKLIEMIETEAQRKREGQVAFIDAKLNALADPQIIESLYAASQAGVKIRLNICGLCCLRPGVEGLSENISVISIVDRYQEHARVFHFHHGGDDRVFISSADWMPRNLDRRVELLVPVHAAAAKKRLIRILRYYFADNVKAYALQPDGNYAPVKASGDARCRSQEVLHRAAVSRLKQAEQSGCTVFEPHRAPEARS